MVSNDKTAVIQKEGLTHYHDGSSVLHPMTCGNVELAFTDKQQDVTCPECLEFLGNVHPHIQEMKPCPFCGKDEPVKKEDKGFHYFQCERCEARGPRTIKEPFAVKLWNHGKAVEELNRSLLVLAEVQKALRKIRDQATRKNRASDLKRYLITDLEMIEKVCNKFFDRNGV
jgi:hypothetical protein